MKSFRGGILDLRDAKARILSNDVWSWPKPGNLLLEGFVFDELGGDASLNPKTQIEWLRLQRPFAVQQPYEQMATVFRNMGYQEESVKVTIAENWDAGGQRLKMILAQLLRPLGRLAETEYCGDTENLLSTGGI